MTFVSNDSNVPEVKAAIQKEIAEIKGFITTDESQAENIRKMLTQEFLNQSRQIALNVNLLLTLIGHQIVSLHIWQRAFSEHIAQIENRDEEGTVEFVEEFIIKAVIDQKIVKHDKIPDLINCIETNSKNKSRSKASVWWIGIAKILNDEPIAVSDIYFQQWLISEKNEQFIAQFLSKISIIFKESQNMSHFLKNALERSLEAHHKFKNTEREYITLDKFVEMVLTCSYSWAHHPNLKVANIADSEIIIIEMMERIHNENPAALNPYPFERIFGKFLKHFYNIFKNAENTDDIGKITRKNDVLMVFANIFKKLCPEKFPEFSFQWLNLISSPYFMPVMLNSVPDYNIKEKWFKMQELFKELFHFLKENIFDYSENSPALQIFIDGVIKIVAVILHDFPEFLVYYNFQFINELPYVKTGNLRNMILAAFPKTLRMPDPKHEIKQIDFSNNMLTYQDKTVLLKLNVREECYEEFKADLDEYLNDQSSDAMDQICEFLEHTQVIINNRSIINTGIIHATMLYLGKEIDDIKSIAELEDEQNSVKFAEMCTRLSIPVRDILLNAMFNELRLLSKTTLYYLNILVYLCRNLKDGEISTSSQIARIFVERRRIRNVYPWGLLAIQNRLDNEFKAFEANLIRNSELSKRLEKED